MKPPVEHVRISTKGKEILIKVKRRTGLEHWNEISRIALCHSLLIPTPPPNNDKYLDVAIDIDWKVFAGIFTNELASLVIYRAQKDGISLNQDALPEYFRAHLERGIIMLQNIKSIEEISISHLPFRDHGPSAST